MRKITKKDIGAALRTSSPIIVTFVVLGIGYGILMEKHGYGPVWSLLSGIIIFSGTAQFVSVTMLSGGSVLMAGITALMISARHVFFSISMIGRYSGEGRRKGYLYYALCDETYAMLSKDDGPEGVNVSNYRLLVTLFDQSAWVIGSFLGGWIGTLLTFDSTGIDFAMTALFLVILTDQCRDKRNRIPALVGMVATAGCRLLFQPENLLIPSMAVMLCVLLVLRKPLSGKESAA